MIARKDKIFPGGMNSLSRNPKLNRSMITQIEKLPSIDETLLLWETHSTERIGYLEFFRCYQYSQRREGKRFKYLAVHESLNLETNRRSLIRILAGTNLKDLKKLIRNRWDLKLAGEGEYLGYKFMIYHDYDLWTKTDGHIFRCQIEGVPAIGGFDSLARQHLHCLGKIRDQIMYLSGVTDGADDDGVAL